MALAAGPGAPKINYEKVEANLGSLLSATNFLVQRALAQLAEISTRDEEIQID